MIDRFCDSTGWQNKIHLEYWMAIRNVINPTADKTIGFYPCCGGDTLAFFLTTDAETAYFVDGIAFGSVEQASTLQSVANRDYYWMHKSIGGVRWWIFMDHRSGGNWILTRATALGAGGDGCGEYLN